MHCRTLRTTNEGDRKTGTAYPAGRTMGDVLAVAVGVAAWAIFAFLPHQRLIGVNPFI